ncbi:MAG: hypothetical protein H0W70_06770 [Actinobacteria bacterium]|nr:hypothetical protein [Actinomycetota bacterium]
MKRLLGLLGVASVSLTLSSLHAESAGALVLPVPVTEPQSGSAACVVVTGVQYAVCVPPVPRIW